MTNKQQILNLLGLAMRAGKLVLGTDSVLSAIRDQKVQLVFFPNDGGQSQAKKFQDKARTYEVPLDQSFTRDELSQAIGANRAAIGVADRGFGRKLKALLQE
jgi:ribosomal protein L7Ae-like RNA K-turn-binding protein